MRKCIDVHTHSCLSPCASDDMIPAVIAIEALDKGIDILALTDHNSTRNLPAFSQACEIAGITPIFGIETTTIEEIHLLSLFKTLEEAMDFGTWIESLLPPLKNNSRLFGHELVVDVEGEVLEELDLFLYGPADISYDELVLKSLNLGALAIPAHIDRHANSVISNLGFLPPLPYSAVESIAYPPTVDTGPYTVIQSSDAHYAEHIGRRRFFIETEKEGFDALKEALELNAVTMLQS
ncbi:MAG: PHP domain-containing protein [Sphaerochaetaceae bacterium]|jgi:PHP family Zn ribbon phosphoesterase